MLRKIRTITKQKGQGIVEYALLLAFIVGLAMMLNSANLSGEVKDTFDKVVALLGGSEYDLSTPEGRLAADKARIKKLGDALAKNFKNVQNGVTDSYDKSGVAVDLKGGFVSVVVLADGHLDIWFDGLPNDAQNNGWHKWYSAMSDDQKHYYDTALKNAGLDLSSVEAAAKTFDNHKLYSSQDEGGIKYGYAISFAKEKNGSNTTVKYYGLKYQYNDNQLGTQDVPRDGLANEDSLTKYGPDNKGQAYLLNVVE